MGVLACFVCRFFVFCFGGISFRMTRQAEYYGRVNPSDPEALAYLFEQSIQDVNSSRCRLPLSAAVDLGAIQVCDTAHAAHAEALTTCAAPVPRACQCSVVRSPTWSFVRSFVCSERSLALAGVRRGRAVGRASRRPADRSHAVSLHSVQVRHAHSLHTSNSRQTTQSAFIHA